MKVLIISHTYITKINRDKWKILAQYHPEIHLTIIMPKSWPGNLYDHDACNVQQENVPNCSFVALDAWYVGNEIKYRYSWKQLYRLIKAYAPTILHVEQGVGAYSYFQALICVRLMKNKPKVIFFTWVNWKHSFSLKHKFLWSWIEKYNKKFSDGAITGNHDAEKLLREQGFLKSIAVIPQLGVNCDTFKPALRASLENIIGYVGRFAEEKGVLLLAQAFSTISTEFPELKLVFVGSGPAEKKLMNFIVDQKLTDRIELRSPVSHEQVIPVLQKLKLLILPSYDTPLWKEQFGHILIEAMACGVPILGSNAGEIPYVINNEELIFEQKSYVDLAKTMRKILLNKTFRHSLSIQGRKRVETEFSHEIIGEKVVAFWKHITKV